MFRFCDPFFVHSLCVSVSVPVSASVCVCVWVRVCTDKRGREPRRQAQGDSGGQKSGTRDQQLGTRRSSWVLLEAYANLQARWRISARPPGRGGCGRAALDSLLLDPAISSSVTSAHSMGTCPLAVLSSITISRQGNLKKLFRVFCREGVIYS